MRIDADTEKTFDSIRPAITEGWGELRLRLRLARLLRRDDRSSRASSKVRLGSIAAIEI